MMALVDLGEALVLEALALEALAMEAMALARGSRAAKAALMDGDLTRSCWSA